MPEEWKVDATEEKGAMDVNMFGYIIEIILFAME